MKHIVIVVILVILLTFGTYVLLQGIGLLPAQASVQAVTIDRMFNLHIMMISFLFSLIIVFMGYSIIVFRQKKGD
jgi:cytochrome c oxidase subunit 2